MRAARSPAVIRCQETRTDVIHAPLPRVSKQFRGSARNFASPRPCFHSSSMRSEVTG